MRHIFFGTGTLVLGLAMLMWATAPISARAAAVAMVAVVAAAVAMPA